MILETIKHFSFDLWLTLIKSNPDFKKQRVIFFYENYNSLHKSVNDIEKIFRTVDVMCNAINEKTGKNIDADEMYLMVIYQINEGLGLFTDEDMSLLYRKIEDIFFMYPPLLFCEKTEKCLDRIKHNSRNTMSILSNTAFIKGSSLRRLLEQLDVAKYFDFQIYSDEVGVSKPNSRMYELLLQQLSVYRKAEQIALHEIMHIGDNIVADIAGAQQIGIRSYQINSNQNRIINLFD